MSNLKRILASLAIATGSQELYQLVVPTKRLSQYEIEVLVEEYNRIKAKKSSLSRRERDLVEGKVNRMIKDGLIDKDLTTKIEL